MFQTLDLKPVLNTHKQHHNLPTQKPSKIENLTSRRSRFTAPQVSGVLHSDRCINCNEFGPYLFLPTCERCCLACLCHSNNGIKVSRFLVMRPSQAKHYFGLSERELREMPKMTIIPGVYNPSRVHLRRRLQLVSYSALPPSDTKSTDTRYLWYRIANQKVIPVGTIVNSPFVASISMPSLDSRNQVVQSGIWCRGCDYDCYKPSLRPQPGDYTRLKRERSISTYRAFSMDEFLRHQDVCTGVRRLQQLHDAGGLDHQTIGPYGPDTSFR